MLRAMSIPRPTARQLKRLTGAAALTLAMIAASCGGGGSEEGGGGGDSSSTGLADCPFDALESADGPIEINMWHTEIGLNLKALEKIVTRYEESQDKVRIKLQFQGTYEEQLKKFEEASGDPSSLPDIVSPDDTVTQYMADSGTVIPEKSCPHRHARRYRARHARRTHRQPDGIAYRQTWG